MRVAITGATGLVGSALTKKLIGRGDEVVALSTAAAEAGGIYTSHLREEGLGLLEGVSEAIEIGRRADIPVVLTHHKVVGLPMWGASATTLAMVDSARAAGIELAVAGEPAPDPGNAAILHEDIAGYARGAGPVDDGRAHEGDDEG